MATSTIAAVGVEGASTGKRKGFLLSAESCVLYFDPGTPLTLYMYTGGAPVHHEALSQTRLLGNGATWATS